jgi:hypothetical protein
MLPGAFPSDYTQPTTRYFSDRPIPPDALPADAGAHRLESAHFPLVVMLVLTQLAAGLFAFLPFLVSLLSPHAMLALASCAFLALHAGLAASVLHLGRPLGAWRFFLGLRTSWMSREILAFGAFSGSTTLTLAAAIGALGGIVFAGLNNPLTVTRDHSLVVKRETLPDCLEITAWTQDESGNIDEIMGVRHKTLDIEGVQFHPELDSAGLKGWLDWGGDKKVQQDGQDPIVMMKQTVAEEEAAKQRTFQLVDNYLSKVAKLI